MSNELFKIEDAEILVKEYNGKRVVTLSDIDMVHERPEGTARRNFSANRNRFINGEDYFIVSADEIRTNRIFTVSDSDHRDKALITETGYLMLVKSLNDDLAWRVQRQLVDGYFRAKNNIIDVNQLPPQMQMFKQLWDMQAQQFIEQQRQAERIAKLEERQETIKEAFEPIRENWRQEIQQKINRIQKATGRQHNLLRTEIYSTLESRAGCDLETRLNNKRNRMRRDGNTVTAINKTNYIDVIAEDVRIKEIFEKIVTEYELKYC